MRLEINFERIGSTIMNEEQKLISLHLIFLILSMKVISQLGPFCEYEITYSHVHF